MAHGMNQDRHRKALVYCVLICLASLLLLTAQPAAAIALTNPPPAPTPAPIPAPNVAYEQRQPHNPDGIGKVYLGREIAQVMGHQGAGWLERPRRESEEQPQKLIAALNLQPTDVIADIGAGTGYFSFRMAALVPKGKVLAVDAQPEMVEILTLLKEENHAANVEPQLGELADPHLAPASIDLALMVDAYHEFEYPREMMTAIAQALKPNGRIVLAEYRGEDPWVFIKPLHKMTQRQVKKEMSAIGLQWLETKKILPQQHVLIFGKSR
jgi:precorrin-6B methylase 2